MRVVEETTIPVVTLAACCCAGVLGDCEKAAADTRTPPIKKTRTISSVSFSIELALMKQPIDHFGASERHSIIISASRAALGPICAGYSRDEAGRFRMRDEKAGDRAGLQLYTGSAGVV